METVTESTYSTSNLFMGVTASWGFSPADVFSNSLFLIGTLSAFILLALAVRYVPKIIAMFKAAVRR